MDHTHRAHAHTHTHTLSPPWIAPTTLLLGSSSLFPAAFIHLLCHCSSNIPNAFFFFAMHLRATPDFTCPQTTLTHTHVYNFTHKRWNHLDWSCSLTWTAATCDLVLWLLLSLKKINVGGAWSDLYENPGTCTKSTYAQRNVLNIQHSKWHPCFGLCPMCMGFRLCGSPMFLKQSI